MASGARPAELELHVGWVLVPAVTVICIAYTLDMLGPALLALLFVPNVFGVHMLLSWQWAVAVLIVELADVQLAAPPVAAFGYCIVGCPYYVLNAHMMVKMRMTLPDRVKFGWAEWITSNVYDFSKESKQIVSEVLHDDSVNFLYKVVFVQFDLLCHLLPMIISLQRHAARITPATVGVMGLAFFCWAALLHRRHLQWLRPYETLRTWKLYFVQAPSVPTLREHMQITYLTDPPLTAEEQHIGLGVALFTTGLLLYLTATARHSIIASWLAWGGAVSVALLQNIFVVLILTVSLTTAVSWGQIFLGGTDQVKPSKAD